MVLGMVDFHRLCIDVRLQGIVGVGKLGEGVGHKRIVTYLKIMHSSREDKTQRNDG